MVEADSPTVQKMPRASLVALPKRLDGSNAPSVQQSLERDLGADLSNVILDCSGTEFLSSAGVRVLVTLARRVKQAGGRLRACSLRPTVRQVFDFSGITTVIAIHQDLAAATVGCE